MLADAPKAPNSIAFAHRIAAIQQLPKTLPGQARESAFVMEVDLKKADDGNGAAIINADRYRRLFPGAAVGQIKCEVNGCFQDSMLIE
jgi:hypothetical protein